MVIRHVKGAVAPVRYLREHWQHRAPDSARSACVATLRTLLTIPQTCYTPQSIEK